MIAIAKGRGRTPARAVTGWFKDSLAGSACPAEGRRESTLAGVVEFHAEGFDPR